MTSSTMPATTGSIGQARPSISGPIGDLYRSEPAFTIAGLLFVAVMIPTAVAAVLDDRMFHGVGIWTKPIKFHLALAVYLLTLAFYARWLPAGMTSRRSYRLYVGVVLFAIAAESVWISGAASIGTASHFNDGTTTAAVLFAIMGMLAAS